MSCEYLPEAFAPRCLEYRSKTTLTVGSHLISLFFQSSRSFCRSPLENWTAPVEEAYRRSQVLQQDMLNQEVICSSQSVLWGWADRLHNTPRLTRNDYLVTLPQVLGTGEC